MPEIPFPTSTEPSVNPSENGGRLINAYAERAPEGSRGKIVYRRAPGLQSAFSAGLATPRGALLVGSVLYIINGEKAYSVTKAGSTYTVLELTGTIGGDGPVIMAHNMKAPTPDVLIVHSGGMSEISAGAIGDFTDADLPAANSICFMDGFFFVTSADGRVFASDINDTGFNELNYATAEASPDGLVRGVPIGRDLLLMGTSTVEFWGNAGNAEGFPFSRGPVVRVGLAGAYAVAGFEPYFPGSLCWVGSDKAVYRLSGYSPQKISTPHIKRLINAVTNAADLSASVYVAGGHPCWVLTGPTWTLVFDQSTDKWHERASIGDVRWRATLGIEAFGEWLTFDRDSAAVFRIHDRERREAGNPLVWEVRSNQTHRHPGRAVVDKASFDFITGVGVDVGIDPIETNPRVSVSWSNDGGRTFGNALLRELGTQGETRTIDVNRTGLTGREGRQWRLQVSDPVEVAFLGASQFIRDRAP